MEVGLVRKVDIDREMQQSYLDFAMSVIVARALPDARDGLKPVQRRILYAMYDMGLRPDSPYKKSARIVGEVLGKYHPHGDMAVYEAMARLAQDFSMRYPVVDGQGNFGSVDGDPPAAMRYTEARLKSFAIDMLAQIDRDTVKFTPNFDASIAEPDVLPAALPNLLVNGSTGIAVGMATNIPPHNLSEVIDALVYLLEQWEHLDDINVSDLMKFIKGPDFPTGGIILQDQNNDILTAYGTGRGRILVRGRVHVEDTGRGRSRLIITELPYMTNKASLIERIAELVREGHIEGISDLRDESDRQGMRIVIELKANCSPEDVLRELYKRTPLESTFGIILLALVDGEPRLLSLKQALRVYLEHRLLVIKRRSEFDLAKAKARAHLLEGLRIAISNLDEVIKIIRAAANVEQARERLIKRFKFSEIQAQAVLDMPLRRLAALERKKIDDEYKEVLKTIKDLETLLKSPKKMREVVETELVEMKQSYGDKRRTQIVLLGEGDSARTLLTTTDLTPAEEVWVGISADGLIARLGSHEPEPAGRLDPRWLLRTNTHHTIYLVSEQGQAAAVAVHALPEAGNVSTGLPLFKVSPFPEGEPLAGVFTVPPRNGSELPETYVLTVSAGGLVKKSLVSELPGPSSQRFVITKVNPGDRLIGTILTSGNDELLLATARGMAIRFSEQEVRPMGLVAAGVNGIKLAAGDMVTCFDRFSAGADVLMLASNSAGWHISGSEFPLQGRYGMGVTACKPPSNVQLVGLVVGKPGRMVVLHFDKADPQHLQVGAIAVSKRQSAGKLVLPARSMDSVIALSAPLDALGFWKPELAIPDEKPKAKRSAPSMPAVKPTEVPAKPAVVKPAPKKAAKMDGGDGKTPDGKVAAAPAKPTKTKAAGTTLPRKTAKSEVEPHARAETPAPGKAAKNRTAKQADVKPAAEKPLKTGTTSKLKPASKPAEALPSAASRSVKKPATAKPEAAPQLPLDLDQTGPKKTARTKVSPALASTPEKKPAAPAKTSSKTAKPAPAAKKPATAAKPAAKPAGKPAPVGKKPVEPKTSKETPAAKGSRSSTPPKEEPPKPKKK